MQRVTVEVIKPTQSRTDIARSLDELKHDVDLVLAGARAAKARACRGKDR